jgi:large subunit ribosomal protein L10
VLSNKEPFELYKDISQSKLKLGAKPKQISPSDILIESGETSIAPGQTVTELKAAGIDVQIQKGKVVISKDKVLVAKGARISGAVANALKILDIKPFEIAPRLDVAVSGGMIYSADVLKVDEEFVKAEISRIFMEAYAMSLELGIPTQYNAKVLIERAYNGAIAVGIEGKIAEPEITAILLAKGAEQAVELAAEAGVDEAKKEE